MSLFGLAEVRCKKDVSKVSAMPGVLVLGGERVHWRCSRGVQADGSSAAHQHPPFVLGWVGYICYTPSWQRIMPPAYLYVDLKVWGIFSLCYCISICWCLPHSWCLLTHWGGNQEVNHKHPPAVDSLVQQFIYVILRSSSALIYHTWLESEISRQMLPKCCSTNRVTNKASILISLLEEFFSGIIS